MSVTPGESFAVVITEAPDAGLLLVTPPLDFRGPRFSATNAAPDVFSFNLQTSSLPAGETLVATGVPGDEIALEYSDFLAFNVAAGESTACLPGFVFATIPIVAAPTPTLMPTVTPTPVPTKKLKKAKKIKVKKQKVKKAKKTKKQKK